MNTCPQRDEEHLNSNLSTGLTDLLTKGVQVTLAALQHPEHTHTYHVGYLHEHQHDLMEQIVASSTAEEAVLTLTVAGLQELAQQKLAIVATSDDGSFVSYIGAEYLNSEETAQRQQGEYPVIELRSSLTVPDHRGYGLNTYLKTLQLVNIQNQTGLSPFMFTDDIPATQDQPAIHSKSMGINQALGTHSVHVADLPQEFQQHLTGPCPPGRCAPRGDHAAPCACKIFITDTKQSVEQVFSLLPHLNTSCNE